MRRVTPIPQQRVKAGMLSIILVISIVIVFITSSVITLAYYYRVENAQLNGKTKLRRNAYSGAQYVLSTSTSELKPMVVDLFGDGTDSVELSSEQWGLLKIGYSRAFSRKSSHNIAFVMGSKPDSQYSGALYIADNNEPVFIGGSTFIKGDVYVSAAGVRKANIKGKPFLGSALITGSVNASDFSVPPIDPALETSLTAFLNAAFQAAKSEEAIPPIVHEPFSPASPRILAFADKVYVNASLTGKIILYSSTEIEIERTSMIQDAIVVAPRITIQSNFEGRLQAFATDTLVIEPNAKLLYPSVACILADAHSLLKIGEGSTVEGVVISANVAEQPSGYVQIAPGAKVIGQLYSNGPIEMLGVIKGNLTCGRTTLRLTSGTYDNHLVDCHIDNTIMVDPNFLGFGITSPSPKRGIIRWLN
jgi:hypothetical protein